MADYRSACSAVGYEYTGESDSNLYFSHLSFEFYCRRVSIDIKNFGVVEEMKNVLSLFNGISGCHLALDRAGIEYGQVYYAEIDKHANQVTQYHYPQDIALGDVTKWQEWNIDWSSIDLVTAGFPCQAWSVAGKQQGDKDERGMLFWTTLEIISNILKHNPSAKWMLENVKMKKEFEEYITHHTTQALGYVEKTLINSALVSAQNRNRYYWTNFEVTQPEDKGFLLKDILESNIADFINPASIPRYLGDNGEPKGYRKESEKSFCLTASMHKGYGNDGCTVVGGAIRGRYNEDGSTSQRLELNGTEKTNSLTTVQKDNVVVFKDKSQTILATIYKENAKSMVKRNKMGLCVSDENSNEYEKDGIHYRKLTPLECERLQTVPDNFTAMLSNTQRYKALGNGWTIDVIAHIFSGLN